MTRALTPIEIMIDAATGFNPKAARTISVLDAESQSLMRLADAASAWRTDETADNLRKLKECCDEIIAMGW